MLSLGLAWQAVNGLYMSEDALDRLQALRGDSCQVCEGQTQQATCKAQSGRLERQYVRCQAEQSSNLEVVYG